MIEQVVLLSVEIVELDPSDLIELPPAPPEDCL